MILLVGDDAQVGTHKKNTLLCKLKTTPKRNIEIEDSTL